MDRRAFFRAAAGGLGAAAAAFTARKGIGQANSAPFISAAALDDSGTFATGAVSSMTVTAHGEGFTSAPADSPLVSWIECPKCLGVFVAQRTNDHLFGTVSSAAFMRRDGSPIPFLSEIVCGDCACTDVNPFALYSRLLRRGPALPPKQPATRPMDIRGWAVGFVTGERASGEMQRIEVSGPLGPGIAVANTSALREPSVGRAWLADVQPRGALATGQSGLSGIHFATPIFTADTPVSGTDE